MAIHNINQAACNPSLNYAACLNRKNNERQTSFGSNKDLLRLNRQLGPSKIKPLLEKAQAEGNCGALAEHIKSVYGNMKNWLEKTGILGEETVTGNHHRFEVIRPHKEHIVLECFSAQNNPQVSLSEIPLQSPTYNARRTHFSAENVDTSSGPKSVLTKLTKIHYKEDRLANSPPLIRNLDVLTVRSKRFSKAKFNFLPE